MCENVKLNLRSSCGLGTTQWRLYCCI